MGEEIQIGNNARIMFFFLREKQIKQTAWKGKRLGAGDGSLFHLKSWNGLSDWCQDAAKPFCRWVKVWFTAGRVARVTVISQHQAGQWSERGSQMSRPTFYCSLYDQRKPARRSQYTAPFGGRDSVRRLTDRLRKSQWIPALGDLSRNDMLQRGIPR